MRTSPPIARSAPIWAATGSLPTAVTPPHSGVQRPDPPATTKARLNCLTPVAWAVAVRLNGGNRLVSMYGAKLAAPADGGALEGGADEGGADEGGADEGGAEEGGVGLAPDEQAAPWIRQPDGAPAEPAAMVTNPTGCEAPGAMSLSQPAAVTVTLPP